MIIAKGGLKRASRYLIAEGADEFLDLVNKQVVETGKTVKDLAEEAELKVTKVTEDRIDAYAEKHLKEYEEAKISLENFKESLSALLNSLSEHTEKKLPFFILIDELDRCRPTYSIAMLERIKHLFDVDNVVFILSTDTTQLSHSIKTVYGHYFDSKKYLRRFFNRAYHLQIPSVRAIIKTIVDSSGVDKQRWNAPCWNYDSCDFLADISERLSLTIRDVEQAMDILLSLTTVWPHSFPIQLTAMFPMIEAYRNDIDFTTDEGQPFFQQIINKTRAWEIDIKPNIKTGWQQTESRTFYEIFKKLMEKSMMDRNLFFEIYRQEVNNLNTKILDRWASSLISNEYSSDGGQQKAKSIIQDYPKLIRSAGRLLD